MLKAFVQNLFREVSNVFRHVKRPTLRVHCWGGLGSQLFAVSYLLELRRLHTNRTLVLVAHEGGVTKRALEIDFLANLNIEVEVVADFTPSAQVIVSPSKINKIKSTLYNTASNLCKRIISATNIVIFSPKEPSKIKPWTRHVRSHYFHRQVNDAAISELMGTLGDRLAKAHSFDAVVHCRLGDLRTIETKNPLPALDLGEALIRATKTFQVKKWCIVSDSPGEVSEYLNISNLNLENFVIFEGDSWDAIRIFSNSRIFISSASKLSLWGIIFGRYINCAQICIVPRSVESEIKRILSVSQEHLNEFLTY